MSKKQAMPPRLKANPKVLGRVLKMLFGYYPVLAPITVACILISAVTAALPAVFMQQVIAAIEKGQTFYAVGNITDVFAIIFHETGNFIFERQSGRKKYPGVGYTADRFCSRGEVVRGTSLWKN